MTTNHQKDTESMIEKFAEDFNIEYKKFKYDQKTLKVRYINTKSSNSEIDTNVVEVPAFIVRRHCEALSEHTTVSPDSEKCNNNLKETN